MERREFLKTAAVGSAALTGLPALVNSLVQPAWAGDQTNFIFVVNSLAGDVAGVRHRIAMTGAGKATPSQVVGGGSFNHFDDLSLVPKSILASGTWKAKRLLSLNLIGTYGALAAGVLEMDVHLVPDGGPVTPATLKFVCNIGAAGLSTGETEGITLAIPDAPFGPFLPFGVGLTVFTTGVEQRD